MSHISETERERLIAMDQRRHRAAEREYGRARRLGLVNDQEAWHTLTKGYAATDKAHAQWLRQQLGVPRPLLLSPEQQEVLRTEYGVDADTTDYEAYWGAVFQAMRGALAVLDA